MTRFLLACILIVMLFGGAGLAWALGGVVGIAIVIGILVVAFGTLTEILSGAAWFFSTLGKEMAEAFREWAAWARAQRK